MTTVQKINAQNNVSNVKSELITNNVIKEDDNIFANYARKKGMDGLANFLSDDWSENMARKAGWDTHGLPVEIEVEKQLNMSGKQDIEKYGIKEFNEKCRESVFTYEGMWREMKRSSENSVLNIWGNLPDCNTRAKGERLKRIWRKSDPPSYPLQNRRLL